MKNKKIIEWVQVAIAGVIILFLGHFYTMKLNDHIYSATHSFFKLPSKIYIWHFLKVEPTTRVNGQTPIQYLLQSNTPLNATKLKRVSPMVDLFLAKGIDINATSTFGLTSFHYAIMDEDPVAVQLLIEKKADVNQPAHVEAQDQLIKATMIEGLTPLTFLHDRKADKLFKNEETLNQIENILVAAGAKTNEKPKVETPKPAPKKPVVKAKKKKKRK